MVPGSVLVSRGKRESLGMSVVLTVGSLCTLAAGRTDGRTDGPTPKRYVMFSAICGKRSEWLNYRTASIRHSASYRPTCKLAFSPWP